MERPCKTLRVGRAVQDGEGKEEKRPRSPDPASDIMSPAFPATAWDMRCKESRPVGTMGKGEENRKRAALPHKKSTGPHSQNATGLPMKLGEQR